MKSTGMKFTMIVSLLLLTISGYSQTTDLYVRIANSQTVVYCGYQPTSVELTNKRVYFSCPEIEIDLKIKKRKKYEWVGVDKNKNVYQVKAGYIGEEFTVLILPKIESGLKAIQFSKADLCK